MKSTSVVGLLKWPFSLKCKREREREFCWQSNLSFLSFEKAQTMEKAYSQVGGGGGTHTSTSSTLIKYFGFRSNVQMTDWQYAIYKTDPRVLQKWGFVNPLKATFALPSHTKSRCKNFLSSLEKIKALLPTLSPLFFRWLQA